MKVKDLLKELKKYPKDTLVLVDGHEDGAEDPQLYEVKVVHDNADPEESFPEYGDYSFYNDRFHRGMETIEAVLISRN